VYKTGVNILDELKKATDWSVERTAAKRCGCSYWRVEEATACLCSCTWATFQASTEL